LGTQKIVAAIRDVAGNMGHATNTVILSVVTNGAYQYSAAGCVTNIAYKGKDCQQSFGLTWDSQYRLTAVSTNSGAVERYGYDPLGRRAWTWDSVNGTNWHAYDGAQVVADLNATGGLIRAYTYGPGIDNLLAITTYGGTASVPSVYYALKDHLGSVLALTDTNGVIVESYRYDAWGRPTVFDAGGGILAESAVGNRFLWQGREYSWKSGLYYFRARCYDPVTGRWLSNDPIGISGGLNQYVFCGNNPVNFRDPWGLCTDDGYPEWRQRHWYDDVIGYFWQTGRNAVNYFGAPWINTYNAAGAYYDNPTLVNGCYLAQAYLPVVIGAGLSAQGSALARSQGNLADDFLNGASDALGEGATIQRGPPGGSDFILRSADGTRQIRLDVTNPHGLNPHVNVETFAPRNAFPGDPRMIRTGNTHVYPGGP
jgi:RHS repeat-associated protein